MRKTPRSSKELGEELESATKAGERLDILNEDIEAWKARKKLAEGRMAVRQKMKKKLLEKQEA